MKFYQETTWTNKYGFKTLTRWLLRAFISIKSLESEISLAIAFSFEFTIKLSLTCNAFSKNIKQVSYENNQWTIEKL